MTTRKALRKYNTPVLLLLMFYENRKKFMCKVLRPVFYFIMENYVCVDYLCCTQTKLHVNFEIKY